ncbi:hypothetical protein F7725_027965 [Dissostichus mawsoni]|uniref:PDZ domain-containing protein n=1 Tax=Dissostichus mawsoni TaxID=36200 RepID=A0A7J5XFP4_DISMA|nr:hypothetical protein F7725_027965 [Dissostichus mawsoni]
MVHSNQAVMTHTNPRPQSARCLLQTKGQKSTDGFQEQLCVRIEKNPGLGFSISGGISGQGNPSNPLTWYDPTWLASLSQPPQLYLRVAMETADVTAVFLICLSVGQQGIFVTRVQHDGPATSALQPGDKILQANGHSFLHMEHETAVSLLKSFQPTVDLVVLREK